MKLKELLLYVLIILSEPWGAVFYFFDLESGKIITDLRVLSYLVSGILINVIFWVSLVSLYLSGFFGC